MPTDFMAESEYMEYKRELLDANFSELSLGSSEDQPKINLIRSPEPVRVSPTIQQESSPSSKGKAPRSIQAESPPHAIYPETDPTPHLQTEANLTLSHLKQLWPKMSQCLQTLKLLSPKAPAV